MNDEQIWIALYNDDFLIREQAVSISKLKQRHIQYLFRDQRFGCVFVLKALIQRHDLHFTEDQFDVLFHYFPLETLHHPEFEPTQEHLLESYLLSPEIKSIIDNRFNTI